MSKESYRKMVQEFAKMKGITEKEAATILINCVKKFEEWRTKKGER